MARKRGKRWSEQVRIKEGGKLVYSESATFDTKGAALAWKARRHDEIKANGWKQVVAASTTLEKLMEDYIAYRYAGKSVSRGVTHSMDNTAYDKDIGKLTLPELTSSAFVEWARKLAKADSAPATILHHLATVRAALRLAPALFNIPTDAPLAEVRKAIDALKQIRLAAPSLKKDNRITDADLEVIMPEFESEQAEIDMKAFVNIAINFPRRREELCSMLWTNLTPDTIKLIDTKDPRKYREEVVPVPPAALARISELPRADVRILPYKPESVSARWQRAVRRVGLDHLRLHDLRHEGICRLFEQGLDIPEVALISGHTSWTTLKRYTHLRPQDVTAKLRATNARST